MIDFVVFQNAPLSLRSWARPHSGYSRYDAVGNRLSQPGVPYAYNASNEMISREGVPYTYDANGNTISKTNTGGATHYTWDFENRLTSVTKPDGSVLSIRYDPFGRSIEQVITQDAPECG